ncbi:ester cyclase [Rhodococcus sp. CSLK01-03]|uniref:Ester cyclase n=1 Tax=Rhodococcus indonesiensis TaxID=3055869 RepID=A0ABT7RQL6_9NOCA|nr:ester cyclase [Rhodococcus indonesiensis]MDM7489951.1 ester cyclase [Rhodococcus indonesiensis]
MEGTAPADFGAGWVSEFGTRWLDSWNSHDPERLLELMADDVVYDDSAWPRTMRGRSDVREFLDAIWRAFPDLTFETVGSAHVSVDGPQAAFRWTARAAHRGRLDPPGLPATGKRVAFAGADFHEYHDGKVARLWTVFDARDLLVQLGVLPKSGSTAEKAVIGLHRLRFRLLRSRIDR